MNDKSQKLSFDLENGRTVVLYIKEIEELDLDEVTKIDYSNLVGEYLTCSNFFNSIANLKAEVTNELSKQKLEFDLWYSRQYGRANTGELGAIEGRITKDKLEKTVKSLKEYKNKRLELIQLERYESTLTNLYWAIQDKSKKLDKLFDKISPEEFSNEIMEKQINNIYLRIKESCIK
jgi:predicted DNA-binding protein YlxM (UPF0122 family)